MENFFFDVIFERPLILFHYRILVMLILLTQFVYQNFRTKLQFKVWEIMKEEEEKELPSYNYR